MKDLKSTFLLVLCLFMSCVGYTQVQADIDGDVKIRGYIDVHHPNDSTSVYIGRNTGINHDPISTGRNTFVGSSAGRLNESGKDNSFFGESAGRNNTTGRSNSFFGKESGQLNTTGINNSFFGENSGVSNTSGLNNSFFGSGAGLSNKTGHSNSFFGIFAGRANTTGRFNSFFGSQTGWNNMKGEYNCFVGYSAGLFNKLGGRNTFLGANADQTVVSDSIDGSIAIGFNAKVGCHNCAVIGGTGDDKVKVGVNTTTPISQLTIKQSTSGDSSGIRLISNSTNRSWEIRHTESGDNLRFRAFADDGSSDHTVEIRRSDGAYLQNSDARLKRDIVYYENVLEDIIKVKPATYYWKNKPSQSAPSLGVIAQELELLFPTAVSANEEGFKMVNYDALGVLAIQAIKEQQDMIQELESEVERLDKQNRHISKRLQTIEDLLKL